MDARNVRRQFPFFRDNPGTVYLDNASTTQKPDAVIDQVEEYLSEASNIGRGDYSLAYKNSEKVRTVREKVADFIGASENEVVFTSGATDSLNMIPEVWGLENLRDGDEVLVSAEGHKSTNLPWYRLKEKLDRRGIGIEIREYRLRTDRQPNYGDIKQKVTHKTRLISLTHIHNSYGSETNIGKVRQILPEDVLISLDACQSISHKKIDVKELDVDFLSFSGHKMFANTGIGVLYINSDIHEKLVPSRKGGGKKGGVPESLEPGTPNISGIVSLGAAVDFIEAVEIESIGKRLSYLNRKLAEELKKIDYINVFSPEDVEGPVVFKTKGFEPGEIGLYLDQKGIFVRTGDHCALEEKTVRVSPHFYNTGEELEELINELKSLN